VTRAVLDTNTWVSGLGWGGHRDADTRVPMTHKTVQRGGYSSRGAVTTESRAARIFVAHSWGDMTDVSTVKS